MSLLIYLVYKYVVGPDQYGIFGADADIRQQEDAHVHMHVIYQLYLYIWADIAIMT